jgi:hypothetical protein
LTGSSGRRRPRDTRGLPRNDLPGILRELAPQLIDFGTSSSESVFGVLFGGALGVDQGVLPGQLGTKSLRLLSKVIHPASETLKPLSSSLRCAFSVGLDGGELFAEFHGLISGGLGFSQALHLRLGAHLEGATLLAKGSALAREVILLPRGVGVLLAKKILPFLEEGGSLGIESLLLGVHRLGFGSELVNLGCNDLKLLIENGGDMRFLLEVSGGMGVKLSSGAI